MLDFINSQLDGGKLDNKERTYFKYQKKVAQTMLKDYEDWSHSTIEWIKSVLKKSSSSLTGHELELLNNRDKTMKYPPDLCDMVLS